MGELLFATYAAVFLAEIAGDKLLYTTSVLASRYRALPILAGVTLAFMLKMAAAVLLGEAVRHLPRWIVAAVTAVGFVGVALAVFRKRDPDVSGSQADGPPQPETAAPRAAAVSFAAVFFSEWGDVGQVTAATLAASPMADAYARSSSPRAAALVVWAGAVAAMMTKGGLAAFLGASVRGFLRRHIPPRRLRLLAVGALALLGALSVLESLGVLE